MCLKSTSSWVPGRPHSRTLRAVLSSGNCCIGNSRLQTHGLKHQLTQGIIWARACFVPEGNRGIIRERRGCKLKSVRIGESWRIIVLYKNTCGWLRILRLRIMWVACHLCDQLFRRPGPIRVLWFCVPLREIIPACWSWTLCEGTSLEVATLRRAPRALTYATINRHSGHRVDLHKVAIWFMWRAQVLGDQDCEQFSPGSLAQAFSAGRRRWTEFCREFWLYWRLRESAYIQSYAQGTKSINIVRICNSMSQWAWGYMGIKGMTFTCHWYAAFSCFFHWYSVPGSTAAVVMARQDAFHTPSIQIAYHAAKLVIRALVHDGLMVDCLSCLSLHSPAGAWRLPDLIRWPGELAVTYFYLFLSAMYVFLYGDSELEIWPVAWRMWAMDCFYSCGYGCHWLKGLRTDMIREASQGEPRRWSTPTGNGGHTDGGLRRTCDDCDARQSNERVLRHRCGRPHRSGEAFGDLMALAVRFRFPKTSRDHSVCTQVPFGWHQGQTLPRASNKERGKRVECYEANKLRKLGRVMQTVEEQIGASLTFSPGYWNYNSRNGFATVAFRSSTEGTDRLRVSSPGLQKCPIPWVLLMTVDCQIEADA